MGTIRKQSVQASLVLAVGVGLGFILKLFIFTAYLNPEEIGLLTVLLDSANLFAAFIPLGSQQIFIKYFPLFRIEKFGKPRGLLLIGVMITSIGFLIFLILYFIFKNPIVAFYSERAPLFSQFIALLIPLVFFRILFTLSQSYARALKLTVFPLIVKEVIVRILTGILVILYANALFDLNALTTLFVAIYFSSGAIMIYYLKKMKLYGDGLKRPIFQGVKKRDILKFGLYATLTGAGAVIVRNIDSLMITTLKGLESTGIYAISFFIGQIIEIPRRAVSQITAPFIAESSAKGDYSKIQILYHKSSINQMLTGGLVLILVWFNLDNLLSIIPNGHLFTTGKYVVLFIGMGKWIDMAMGVNGNIIQQSPYYQFNFWVMIVLGLLTIITNLIFIPIYGLTGAALASFLAFFIINFTKSLFIWHKLRIHPFQLSTLLTLLSLILISLTLHITPSTGISIVDIFINTFIAIGLFIVLLWKLNISEDLISLLWQILKKMGIK